MAAKRLKLIETLLPALLIAASPSLVLAGAPPAGKTYDTFTVYWENDTFAGTDRDYTNGLRFTWSTPYTLDSEDGRLPPWSRAWLRRLPGESERRAVSASFGHSIYTPTDTGRADPDPNDRPYAGYAYAAATFHYRTARVKTSWEFQLGVVGPLSFAEEFQNWSHDLLGTGRARGWEHQLENEPTLEAVCERYWLLRHDEDDRGFNFDFIPHLGGQVGNVNVSLNLGLEFRVGWNLPHSFGTCPIRAGCESNSAFITDTRPVAAGFGGIHFFVGVDGRAVFHDIFLDGNTFRDSPSVDREPLVGDVMAGVALTYGRVRASYSYVLRSREFTSQDGRTLFGAVSVSRSF